MLVGKLSLKEENDLLVSNLGYRKCLYSPALENYTQTYHAEFARRKETTPYFMIS